MEGAGRSDPRRALVAAFFGVCQATAAVRVSLRRATSAVAAAPNSSTIGGAGTGAGGPPLDPVLPDPLELPHEEPLELELDNPLELPEPLDPFDDQLPLDG